MAAAKLSVRQGSCLIITSEGAHMGQFCACSMAKWLQDATAFAYRGPSSTADPARLQGPLATSCCRDAHLTVEGALLLGDLLADLLLQLGLHLHSAVGKAA